MDKLITTENGGKTVSPVLPPNIKNFLIDIDGTICEDIPNEEPERMATAEVFPDALEQCNRWLPNGRASKRGLARAISDAGWGSFRLMLGQKAERYGRELRLVNPAFTSQRCSCCGHIEKANRKSQAEFKCLSCGHAENADVNAAKNILAAGQAARPSASCAESPERGQTKRTAEPMRQPCVKSQAAGCEASTHLKVKAHAA